MESLNLFFPKRAGLEIFDATIASARAGITWLLRGSSFERPNDLFTRSFCDGIRVKAYSCKETCLLMIARSVVLAEESN